MKPRFIYSVLALALALGLRVEAESLTVFAAASLTESLKEIGAAYEKQSGDKIVFNFAGSGPLRRQIEEGAPADVFFSADEATMDTLERKALIAPETRRHRLSNRLALVTIADSPLRLTSARDLANAPLKRLAIGDPKIVPAGTYTKEYLSKLGLWSGLESRLVPCESVRAVLAAVESGNVDAGFVYQTDAAISRGTKIAFEVPAAEGPAIRYPMAMVKETQHPDAAKRFLVFLSGPEAGKVFERRGFIIVTAEPAK
ncbi:MAG: molybdate ABC transporter substrate-binding protein [Verrucomicrobiales bacterium]|nr:molybdate ABC transporter substrate-binding protein [Verrucomicrobiales bacterium]